jgi:hypothetical protein
VLWDGARPFTQRLTVMTSKAAPLREFALAQAPQPQSIAELPGVAKTLAQKVREVACVLRNFFRTPGSPAMTILAGLVLVSAVWAIAGPRKYKTSRILCGIFSGLGSGHSVAFPMECEAGHRPLTAISHFG